MKVSQKGIDFIKSREGLKLVAYQNPNDKPTIGYGNRFYENGTAVKLGDKITLARAEQLFLNILNSFATQVAAKIISKVNQSQFDALVSYSYNRGINSFSKSQLLVLVNINPNNLKEIARQFVIEWGTNQTYKKSLIERRQKEAELYISEPQNNDNSGFVLVAALIATYYILNK